LFSPASSARSVSAWEVAKAYPLEEGRFSGEGEARNERCGACGGFKVEGFGVFKPGRSGRKTFDRKKERTEKKKTKLFAPNGRGAVILILVGLGE